MQLFRASLALILVPFISFISCSRDLKILEIASDKELIPEGIAIYPVKSTLYLSSIHKDKIIAYDLKSGQTRDLIDSGEYGYKHGIGIEIKDTLLFALSSEYANKKGSSLLMVYDLKGDRFVKNFQLEDTISHFMNDLAISKNLEVYISDTERHMVYKLQYPDGKITPYLEDKSLDHPNGIAISDQGEYLYVDSWTEGLRIVDLSIGKIVNPPYSDSPKRLPVDGLKYYGGNLYGIRNGDREKELHSFVRIELGPDKRDLDTIIPLLTGHPNMNIPTTFCIDNGYAYILANSQLEELDQENNRIVNKENLTNTYIIKIKL